MPPVRRVLGRAACDGVGVFGFMHGPFSIPKIGYFG
jgi:hypothetical protein